MRTTAPHLVPGDTRRHSLPVRHPHSAHHARHGAFRHARRLRRLPDGLLHAIHDRRRKPAPPRRLARRRHVGGVGAGLAVVRAPGRRGRRGRAGLAAGAHGGADGPRAARRPDGRGGAHLCADHGWRAVDLGRAERADAGAAWRARGRGAWPGPARGAGHGCHGAQDGGRPAVS